MIDFLVSWTEQLVITLIIIIVIEMVLPNNSSYRKYIKMILGVFLIYCIINPFISNKIKNINFNEFIDNKKIDSQPLNIINNDKQIEKTFLSKFETNLNEYIKERGYEIVKLDGNIEYKNKELTVNSISLKVRKNRQENKVVVNKVEIGESNKAQNEKIEDLKNQICEYYGISKSKISISESEK